MMNAAEKMYYAIGAYLLTESPARWKGVPGESTFQWIEPGSAPEVSDAIARGEEYIRAMRARKPKK